MESERFSRLLDIWARWRVIPERQTWWKKQNLLKKLMDSVPTDQCPRCVGHGEIRLPGIGKAKCPICLGRKKIGRADTRGKISPAMIPSTSHPLDDSTMERMEQAFAQELTPGEQEAVEAEVYMGGEAQDKARKLRTTPDAYYKRISRGLGKMRKALDS